MSELPNRPSLRSTGPRECVSMSFVKRFVPLVAVLMSCGPMPGVDGGTTQVPDAGTPDAGPRPDAGVVDAGPLPIIDAGPPERTAMGGMTVNGTPYEFWTGFGSQNTRTHQLRMSTRSDQQPSMELSMTLPSNASQTFTGMCGSSQPLMIFSVQYRLDGGTAYFNVNQICSIAMSSVALDGGDDYVGSFSATVDFEPRSLLDAGFPKMVITNGNFRVRRN